MKLTITSKSCRSFIRRSKTIAQGFRYAGYALLGYICSVSLSANAATVYMNDFQGVLGSDWGSEWSTTAASGINTASAPLVDYGGTRLFLGQYGNDTLTLSLGGLAAHTTTTVSFSLYLIRSWDGNDPTVADEDLLGNDTWSLSVGGSPILLSTTFSNGNSVAGQNYNGAFSTYTVGPGTPPCDTYADYTGSGEAPLTGANECYSLGYTFSYPNGYTYSDGHTCTNPNGCPEAMDSVYNLSFMFAHNASDLILNFSAAGLQGIADESWGLDNVMVQVTPVPLPAAVWLFGSGLLGLFGIARRRIAT
jgi:hypothetical protein